MPAPSLRNQIAVVSGGTQGIGWAISQALAAQGATVYAFGYSQASLEQAQAALVDLPGRDRIHLSRCDVTDHTAYVAFLTAVSEKNGRLDILVNNAAFVRWEDVLAMSQADAEQSMAVSYKGMVTGIKTVLPRMLAVGQGHIVNIGSLTARIFVPGSSAAYAAAKAAVDAYTLMLQIELEPTPVNATLVRLGTVAGTNFFKTHVPVGRMAPLTRFIPALTPPRVAQAIVRAIHKKQAILTLPGYMHWLTIIYNIMPGFSRWLSRRGGQNKRDYGDVAWEFRQKKE